MNNENLTKISSTNLLEGIREDSIYEMQETKEELESKVKESEIEIKSLIEENMNLNEVIRAERNKYKELFELHIQEQKKLQAKIDQLSERIENKEDSRLGNSSEFSFVDKSMDIVKGDINYKIHEYRVSLDRLQNKIMEGARLHTQQLRESERLAEEKLKENFDLYQKQCESNDFSKRMHQLKAQLTANIASLKRTIIFKDAEIENLKGIKEAWEGEKEELNAIIGASKSKINTLNSMITLIEGENSDLKKELSEHKEQIKQTRQEYTRQIQALELQHSNSMEVMCALITIGTC